MIKRYRFWVFTVLSLIVIGALCAADGYGGQGVLEQLRSLAGIIVAAPVVYIIRRALVDAARGNDLVEQIRRGNTAAGLAYLGLCILTGLLFLAISPRALAADLPLGARQYLPVLTEEAAARWPDLRLRSVLAAQVEQESGWRITARLKTAREEGIGLGQFTRAYDAQGKIRFDAIAEARALDPTGLAGWSWANATDPRLQLHALVVKNRDCYRRQRRQGIDEQNALAMCDSAYNGGLGGLAQDQRLCAAQPGCDPRQWFGHVELTSNKSRVKWQGYGASAYDINRGHVRAVMITRRPKYADYYGEVV